MENTKNTMTDIHGDTFTLEKGDWLVTATDKVLSGWGLATNKTHKQIIICHSYSQACGVADKMKTLGFIYVKTRRSFPPYSSNRYTWSIRYISECPLWR